MEFFLNRFRNFWILLVVILAQLALLAYQIKTNQNVRLIRVWSVSTVTPVAQALETVRSGTSHFFRDYFVLLGVRQENKRMKAELDRVEMENQYLRAQLSTADRAKALAIFQASSQSKTIAAHIIGNTTDTGAKAVIVDRGSRSGIQKDMAVITPEGIVGKVIDVYPTASYVLLITDPGFAAGVVSEKHHVHGTLKGQGNSTVIVDYVQNEEPLDQGEWFYTSGDDLIFPRGLPVGEATVVRPGHNRKDIYVTPSGFQNGLEEVLIIVEGVHGVIPTRPAVNQQVSVLPPPPDEDAQPVSPTPQTAGAAAAGSAATTGAAPSVAPTAVLPKTSLPGTDADRLLQKYRAIGAAQNHVYGDGKTHAPNFNAVPNPTGPGAKTPPPHP